MAERSGVEIDYCPQCRGVWLDRGELDKIIERAEASPVAAPQPAPQQGYAPQPQQPGYQQPPVHPQFGGHGSHHGGKHGYGGYRKKSMLSELFDF
jgi:hypothetical protein